MAFIGFEEQYKEYKKEKVEEHIIGTGNKIAYDNMPDISDEDLKIITESRCRKDPYTVYMQSDESFYDEHYNEDESKVDWIDKDFLEEVKSVRRIYKNFFQYNNAIRIIDKYYDILVDKYGGEDMFRMYANMGLIKEWIPPNPVYAKSSPDYQLYLEGKLDLGVSSWDDDLLEACMNSLQTNLADKIPIESIGVRGDVITDPKLIASIQDVSEPVIRTTNNAMFGSINANDIQQMEQMLRSWMDPESELRKQQFSDNGNKSRYFSSTEEEIRRRYYESTPITAYGLSEAIRNGYYEEEEDDPNEMVMDPVSNRPMTRGELQKREFVRTMKDAGWNELRLMRRLNVGSNFELKLMESKERNRKRAKKKAMSLVDDIVGSSVDEIYSIDEMNNLLFDD